MADCDWLAARRASARIPFRARFGGIFRTVTLRKNRIFRWRMSDILMVGACEHAESEVFSLCYCPLRDPVGGGSGVLDFLWGVLLKWSVLRKEKIILKTNR